MANKKISELNAVGVTGLTSSAVIPISIGTETYKVDLVDLDSYFGSSGAPIEYETGTWTPTLSFSGVTTGIVYSRREGFYTKIGDTVTLSGNVTLTNKGNVGVGEARLVSVPFLINVDDATFSLMWYDSITTPVTQYIGALYGAGINEFIRFGSGGFGYTNGLGWSDFSNTSAFRFTIVYKIR